GPRAPRPRPVRPATVVLHVEPARRFRVPRDLVDALAELGIRIGVEARAHALVGGPEGVSAVLAQVVAARRDAEVHAAAVPHDRVPAPPACSRRPLPRMLVVADARHHLPGVAAVPAPEEGGGLDTAPQLLLAVPGLEGPDIAESPAVVLGEGGSRPRPRQPPAQRLGAQARPA